MQGRVRERHEEIAHIQNAVWKMYKDFLSDHDMAAYNSKAVKLAKKYQDKGDGLLFEFCKDLLFDWSKIINTFSDEFREENRQSMR